MVVLMCFLSLVGWLDVELAETGNVGVECTSGSDGYGNA
jgi:hypothetical protein